MRPSRRVGNACDLRSHVGEAFGPKESRAYARVDNRGWLKPGPLGCRSEASSGPGLARASPSRVRSCVPNNGHHRVVNVSIRGDDLTGVWIPDTAVQCTDTSA